MLHHRPQGFVMSRSTGQNEQELVLSSLGHGWLGYSHLIFPRLAVFRGLRQKESWKNNGGGACGEEGKLFVSSFADAQPHPVVPLGHTQILLSR